VGSGIAIAVTANLNDCPARVFRLPAMAMIGEIGGIGGA
jgi:hypothetical protein